MRPLYPTAWYSPEVRTRRAKEHTMARAIVLPEACSQSKKAHTAVAINHCHLKFVLDTPECTQSP